MSEKKSSGTSKLQALKQYLGVCLIIWFVFGCAIGVIMRDTLLDWKFIEFDYSILLFSPGFIIFSLILSLFIYTRIQLHEEDLATIDALQKKVEYYASDNTGLKRKVQDLQAKLSEKELEEYPIMGVRLFSDEEMASWKDEDSDS